MKQMQGAGSAYAGYADPSIPTRLDHSFPGLDLGRV